ncbi:MULTISPECIES: ABC transporter ATP-binding protein [unclassified Pantoea]|uniref:ABC transporter ATP-binding protein n=1 Tax=unclassified Pantoea TaxID=2630326 RepID=UPI00301BD233
MNTNTPPVAPSLWRALLSPLRAHQSRLFSTLAAGIVAQCTTFTCMIIAGWICTLVLSGSSPDTLWFFTAVLAFCVVLTALARWALAWLSHDLAFALIETLQMSIFDGIARASPGRSHKQRMGDIAATATSDAELMERFYAHMLVDYLTAFLMPGNALVILLFVSPWLCVIFFPCVLMIVLAPLFSARWAKKQGKAVAESKSVLNSHIAELAQGWRDIQMFGAEGRYSMTLQQANARLNNAQRKYGARNGLEQGLRDGLMALSLIALLVASLNSSHDAGLSLAWLPFILSIGAAAIVPLLEVLQVGGQWGALRASAERIFLLQQLPEQVHDGLASINPQGHRLQFNNVSFCYPQSDTPVLNNLSFTIEPGERVAIAGMSGSGKTTLAYLLLRFYDPTSGTLSLNGTDLSAFSLKTLRQQIAWVSQESWLFNDTIENNIRLGRPDATFSQIEQAAKSACANEFICKLPQGYQTICTKGGENLSGGQRQRIALARALVSDAPVIILDEVSAGLDGENERMILAALESLPKTCTLIMIAHRIPMLKSAERILLLANGRIAAAGSFDALTAEGTSLSALLENQHTK